MICSFLVAAASAASSENGVTANFVSAHPFSGLCSIRKCKFAKLLNHFAKFKVGADDTGLPAVQG
jgi:hypothetical protein